MQIRINFSSKLYLAPSSLDTAGRGVFARESITAGEHIEQCPVVALFDPKARALLRKTELVNYYFLWGEDPVRVAICLGWGSIYNHSYEPNAKYEKHMDDARMDFYALRDIKEGEEILVNYNGDPEDKRPLRLPGVPESAGGPATSGISRFKNGVLRRLQLLVERISPFVFIFEVAAF